MTEGSLEHNMAAAVREHLVPGRQIHAGQMRGNRFCELGLITGTGPDNAVANIWNTTGASGPGREQIDGFDADTVARENGALRAWLDPDRRWMLDRLDVWEAGDDNTFAGITATWMGVAGAATMTHTAFQDSYDPGYIRRSSTATYSTGSEVYLLDAPDGEVFIMQSLTPHPDATEDDLAHLSRQLDLPGGWGFRAETIDEDLEVTSNPDNLAHVVQDNLGNSYQGSDAGRAFSRFCRQYERW